MEEATNRKQRRARESVSRKASPGRTADLVTQKQLGDALSKLAQNVNTAIQQLSTNQERLGNMLNNNQAALVRAFSMTDGHLYVLRAILTDVQRGTARLKPMHPDDAAWLETKPSDEEISRHVWLAHTKDCVVDYEWYYEQYNAKMKAAAEAAAAAEEAAAEEAAKDASAKEPGPAAAEGPDVPADDFVFGGDYAGQNASPG